MRYHLLWLCFLLGLKLSAQYGTTYQFHFTLQDVDNGFNSATDTYKIKGKNRGHHLRLKAKNCSYEIKGGHHQLFEAKGHFVLSYSAIPPGVQFDFTIDKIQGRSRSNYVLQLRYPEDEDFAQLNWQADSISLNLAFDKPPFEYRLVTPQTADGKRDLSCLIAQSCDPNWELSELGKYRQEQRTKRKFLALKQQIDYCIDSLLAAHFSQSIMDKLLEMNCKTAFYHGDTTYTAPVCEVPIDTNLYGITRQYHLKSETDSTGFELSVHASLNGSLYIEEWQFDKKKFQPHELRFIPPAKMITHAQQTFPGVSFIEKPNGESCIKLVYLNELPQDYREFPGGEPPVYPSASPKANAPDFGTFAYMMQSLLPDQGKWYGTTNYYFYAHKARLITQTENYYDLTNE